jgi:hypothetical protein
MLRCPTDKLLNCQDSEAIKYFDLDNMFLFFCSETSNFRSDFAVVQAQFKPTSKAHITAFTLCMCREENQLVWKFSLLHLDLGLR